MSARGNQVELVLGGEPRVNLLPPEVGLRKRARAQRRMLGLLVVLALAIVAAGYGFASLRAVAAQAGLAAAQERTVQLLGEQAQYAEASQVAGMLTSTRTARSAATANEVIWGEVLDAVVATLPDGVLVSWDAASPLPWEGSDLVPAGPLRQPRVASLLFVVASDAPIDVTALFAALSRIEGFADASLDQETHGDGEPYKSTVTLNLGQEALAGRYPALEVSQ